MKKKCIINLDKLKCWSLQEVCPVIIFVLESRVVCLRNRPSIVRDKCSAGSKNARKEKGKSCRFALLESKYSQAG